MKRNSSQGEIKWAYSQYAAGCFFQKRCNFVTIRGGEGLKLVSWNIDSLNSALTGVSARAVLSREVINTIVEIEPEVIAFQETKLPSDGPSKKHLEMVKELNIQKKELCIELQLLFFQKRHSRGYY
jgi:endonuclease/exonuclease/phosphatase family metal-dependent hydrolase